MVGGLYLILPHQLSQHIGQYPSVFIVGHIHVRIQTGYRFELDLVPSDLTARMGMVLRTDMGFSLLDG